MSPVYIIIYILCNSEDAVKTSTVVSKTDHGYISFCNSKEAWEFSIKVGYRQFDVSRKMGNSHLWLAGVQEFYFGFFTQNNRPGPFVRQIFQLVAKHFLCKHEQLQTPEELVITLKVMVSIHKQMLILWLSDFYTQPLYSQLKQSFLLLFELMD